MLDTDLTQLIGFCGFKGSGKDTAADYLAEKYGYTKISFAYPLKKAAQIIWGFSDESLWGSSSLREKLDPRFLFSGLDPLDGSLLTKVADDAEHYWQRESDGEWFPQYLTPRIVLQALGTEHGRRFYPDVWVDACLRHIRLTGNPKHAISDVRFENELLGVQRAGGAVVRLLRGKRESSHQSELELEAIPLSEFDFVVDNRGPKKELYRALDEVIDSISARVSSE